MKLTNAAETKFQLDVHRDIQLLTADDFAKLFGAEAQASLTADKLKSVGFQTGNTIVNTGPAMKKESGLVSIWVLSMMNSSPETVIIVPYRGGSESEPRSGGEGRLFRTGSARAAKDYPGGDSLPRRQPLSFEDRRLAAPREADGRLDRFSGRRADAREL